MTVQDMLGMVLSFANFVAAFQDFFVSGSVLSVCARPIPEREHATQRYLITGGVPLW